MTVCVCICEFYAFRLKQKKLKIARQVNDEQDFSMKLRRRQCDEGFLAYSVPTGMDRQDLCFFFGPLFIEIRQDLIRLGPVENLLFFYCGPQAFHQAPSANVPVFIPCNKRMLWRKRPTHSANTPIFILQFNLFSFRTFSFEAFLLLC